MVELKSNQNATAEAIGDEMYNFVSEQYSICRSITGDGVRATLVAIKQHIPDLTVHEVATGTPAFDWTVPDEWNVRSARLFGPDGKVVVDFANHNLHVLGYSEPVDLELSLEELQSHLYSLPDKPDAIPYVTSYYTRRWGFCLAHNVREALRPGTYRAIIDSDLKPGSLTYGELILPGEKESEVLLSTYVCHPSMANNELSGPAVTTWLVKWLMQQPRRHTYRIVFIPETIGSIVYLSKNLEHMKKATVAGFNISCIGDERCYSYLASRDGNTLSDRIARYVLGQKDQNFKQYSYLDRGSDERQYCAPGVDLPVCSVMRSKYGEYPEYHTSSDNLDLVTPQGLAGGYDALRQCIELIERNRRWKSKITCEPQLGKYGLYPTISDADTHEKVRMMKNVIAYSDGSRDILELAQAIQEDAIKCADMAENLARHGVLTDCE